MAKVAKMAELEVTAFLEALVSFVDLRFLGIAFNISYNDVLPFISMMNISARDERYRNAIIEINSLC